MADSGRPIRPPGDRWEISGGVFVTEDIEFADWAVLTVMVRGWEGDFRQAALVQLRQMYQDACDKTPHEQRVAEVTAWMETAEEALESVYKLRNAEIPTKRWPWSKTTDDREP